MSTYLASNNLHFFMILASLHAPSGSGFSPGCRSCSFAHRWGFAIPKAYGCSIVVASDQGRCRACLAVLVLCGPACLEDLNAGNPRLCQEISAGAGVGINETASGACPGPALIERPRMHLAGGVVAPEDLIDSANFFSGQHLPSGTGDTRACGRAHEGDRGANAGVGLASAGMAAEAGVAL